MRIAALRGPREFVVEEVDVPTPAPDEVLVQVAGRAGRREEPGEVLVEDNTSGRVRVVLGPTS